MRFIRALIVLALSGSYLSYVFHVSGGRLPTAGLGDWMDPYFINFLLEHWYQAARHLGNPASPPMYLPVPDTLGYSHALILYAPFYGAVRPFLDPFQAESLALILVIETGTVCLYLILRRFLRLAFIESLLLSAFFLTSANVINGGTAAWSQRASVFLIPSILLVGLISLRMRAGRLRLGLAALFGLLAALLFTQELYTALFALLISAILLVGVCLCARQQTASFLRRLWRVARFTRTDTGVRPARLPSVWWAVASGICLVASAVIFIQPLEPTLIGPWRVSIRHPTRLVFIALLTGGWYLSRRFDLVTRFVRASRHAARTASAAIATPGPELSMKGRRAHVRNVGTSWLSASALGAFAGMLVFVWIYLGVYQEHPAFPEEHLLESMRALNPAAWHRPSDVFGDVVAYDSLRPFTLVWLLGGLAWVPWFRISRRARLYSLWCLLLSVVVLVIPLRVSAFSVWGISFAHIPGLSVVRDPKRIIYVYELAVALLAGLFLTQITRTRPRVLIAAIPLVLIATDWNAGRFQFDRQYSHYRQWVDAPIEIDPSCRSFFIRGASDVYMSRSPYMWPLYSLDAGFISLKHSIPTLNGYSAWQPENWNLANPQEGDYESRVRTWIERHALRDVCALDIDARTLKPFQ